MNYVVIIRYEGLYRYAVRTACVGMTLPRTMEECFLNGELMDDFQIIVAPLHVKDAIVVCL